MILQYSKKRERLIESTLASRSLHVTWADYPLIFFVPSCLRAFVSEPAQGVLFFAIIYAWKKGVLEWQK